MSLMSPVGPNYDFLKSKFDTFIAEVINFKYRLRIIYSSQAVIFSQLYQGEIVYFRRFLFRAHHGRPRTGKYDLENSQTFNSFVKILF